MTYDETIEAICERLSISNNANRKRIESSLQRLFDHRVKMIDSIREPYAIALSQIVQSNGQSREDVDWESANPSEAVMGYLLGLIPKFSAVQILSEDAIKFSTPVDNVGDFYNNVIPLASQPLSAVERLYLKGLVPVNLYEAATSYASLVLKDKVKNQEEERAKRSRGPSEWRTEDDYAEVIVYSKPACVECNATYRALTKRKIKYEVIDVTEDENALAHILALGYPNVPVVEVVSTGEHWYGYRPDKISKLRIKASV